MRDGFVKVAAVTPDIRVADVAYNTQNICKMIDETVAKGAKVIVFPELCVTGYTCSDLFTQDILLKESKEALFKIAEYTKEKDAIIFIGVPLAIDGELYNVAAALNHGEILGLTTKTFLPNYGEFYEMRQFRPGPDKARWITLDGKQIPFGPQLLFVADQMEELVISAEICEDVWSPVPPSTLAAREGATVIVNCSASDETIGKASYRESLIEGQSARLICGYIYANAGVDAKIPLIPAFILVYFGCYIFWVINYLLISLREEEIKYRFFTADLYARIICFLFFVFYPTTNVRPELVGNGIFVQGMRFLYQIDKPVNLFPSIHCMASWFCCIGIRRDKKIPVWYKIVSVMIAVLVFVSTLVTKQHVIVDVIGGVVVAELTWFVSCRTNGWKIYRNLVHKAGGENGK